LYKKARAGLLPNLSGIGSPYEPPGAPQLALDSATTTKECVARVLGLLP